MTESRSLEITTDPAVHPTNEDGTKKFWYSPFIVLLAVLTVVPALFSGQLLGRWGVSPELVHHAITLDRVPLQIGDWKFVTDGREVDPLVVKQLELQGTLHRIYENEETGQKVSMLLLVGPAGPLVRHPPEICYGAQANQLQSTSVLEVGGLDPKTEFRLIAFRSNTPTPEDFLVAYAFGSEGRWANPSSPRMAYAGLPMLYKLQVLTDSSQESNPQQPAGLSSFLRALLPVLNERFSGESAN